MSAADSTPHAGLRVTAWAALLAAAAILGSWAFACVMPFAAVAVIAARTLELRGALAAVGLVWAANQAVGFLLLDYPFDATTLLWGAALLVAVLLATGAAAAVQLRSKAIVGALVGFAAAFTVYEAGLFAASVVLGGAETFAPNIVLDVLKLNAVWLVTLYAASAMLGSRFMLPRRAAAA